MSCLLPGMLVELLFGVSGGTASIADPADIPHRYGICVII